MTARLTPFRLWITIFGVWLVLLSGVLAGIGGSPGIIQSLRLKHLFAVKQDELGNVETEVRRLEDESARLERSRFAQEREIRKVLGYAAEDEIIFQFGPSGEATLAAGRVAPEEHLGDPPATEDRLASVVPMKAARPHAYPVRKR